MTKSLSNPEIRLIERIERACLMAATHIVSASSSNRQIKESIKPDGSLVLQLDLEAQQIIDRELDGVLPLVGEESPHSHSTIGSKDSYIVVDPIDGTSACKRFLRVRGGQVGFGPLIGVIESGQVKFAVFYHVPDRALYTAALGHGCYRLVCDPHISIVPDLLKRKRLKPKIDQSLSQCAVLFYPSTEGEGEIVDYLKARSLIEVPFRFGSFASDSTRLAQGFEQIQIQFKVKAWDSPALLFANETGFEIVFEPLGTAQRFSQWEVKVENPVVVAPPHLMDDLIGYMKASVAHQV